LRELGSFSEAEIEQVCTAAAAHTDKQRVEDSAMAELLKDADVLQHYLYNPQIFMDRFSDRAANMNRLARVLAELGIKARV
jgi:uncharacterized protein